MAAKPKITHEMEIGRKMFTLRIYDINFIWLLGFAIVCRFGNISELYILSGQCYISQKCGNLLIALHVCMSSTFLLGVKKTNFIFS